MAAKRRRVCATEGCGAAAFGKRVEGKWQRFDTCRRCMMVANVAAVVTGWKDHEMRYHRRELELLRELERLLRLQEVPLAWPAAIFKLFDDLSTLRSLQSASQSSSPT